MNILHYSIGLYPDRSGGLVRYSTDLAIEQSKQHNVYYLMPGKLGIIDKRVRIVEKKQAYGVNVYVVDNAHPIPVYSGIKDVDLYTKKTSVSLYSDFLLHSNIQVIYIHSLMGLHYELIQAANENNICTIMIAHDFFGMCPITTYLKNGHPCHNTAIDENCFVCSENAYSYTKLAFGQSKLYKQLKKLKLLSGIRNAALANRDVVPNDTFSPDTSLLVRYKELNEYYLKIFNCIDFYIFNSSQTRNVFETRIGTVSGTVINLLHNRITDRRKKRSFLKDKVLHIGFMGESTAFKGFEVLKKAVQDISEEGFLVELDVYNDSVLEDSVTKRKGKYSSDELDSIYDSLDIIVVPSICYETLSFTVIEAMSSGMPCLVSDRVGAKDLVENYKTGFIVSAGNIDSIKCVFRDILSSKISLERINLNIIEQSYDFSFVKHCETMMDATLKIKCQMKDS